MVPHPSDHGGFCTLLDRDSFGSRYGAAAHRRGVLGDGTGKSAGEFGVGRMKVEKRQNRCMKILDVLLLDNLPTFGGGLFSFGEFFGGSFGFELCPNPIDVPGRSPHALGEYLAAFLLLHDPVIAGGFHAAGEGGIAGQKQNPAGRHGQNFAAGRSDGV